MMSVIQLEKRLECEPVEVEIGHFQLRSFFPEEDIATWLRVRQMAFAHELPTAREWTTADFDREIQAAWWWDPAHCWLAFRADVPGECVGTVLMAFRGAQNSATPSSATPAVHWLAVVPQFRRQGVARLLLNRLERTAWRLGHRRVLLETHAGWTNAIRLYTALGYR